MSRTLKAIGLFAVAGALTLTACGATAPSDEAAPYPEGVVTMIVPFSAGGPSDTTARATAECLGAKLGEEVVVENRPGAAGTIGTTELVRSEPDGQTLGLVSTATAVVGPIFQDDVNYTHDDLEPVATLAELPSVIAVSPDSEYQSIDELLNAAKAGPIAIAVPGTTTLYGIEISRMASEYGVQLQAVPFEGGAQARAAALGGNVDAVWDAGSQDFVDAIEDGQFKALATGGERRLEYLDVPTLAELGYPDIVHSTTLFNLAAPAGTPAEIVSTLESMVRECQTEETVVTVVGERYIPERFIGAEDLAEKFDELADLYSSLS